VTAEHESVRRMMALFPDCPALVVDAMGDGVVSLSPFDPSSGLVVEGMSLIISTKGVEGLGVPLYERNLS
jgi:hypothetical protein